MKNLFLKLTFVGLVGVFCGLFTGCVETMSGTGDFSLTVKEVGADYVDIFVTAPNSLEVAYVVSDEPVLSTPAVLFVTGTVITVKPGELVRITEGIVQDTEYQLYAAAKLDEKNYSEVVKLSFTTKKYEFDETVTIVETYLDGFKAHVTIPEEVKKAGNVLRYGVTSLAMYNKATQLYQTTDVDRLIGNGNVYGRYIKNDSTLVFNNDNIYEKNPDGTIWRDPESGEAWDIHDPIAPGEPCVFLVGEFKWAETSEEIENTIGIAGWDPAYIIPMYDFRTDKWTGEFKKTEFRSKEPELLEAEIDIEVSNITPVDADIYISVDDNVYQYIYACMDMNTYNAMLDLCGGNEDYIQWFLTSYLAVFELGCTPNSGNLEINAASHFYEPLSAGEDYVIVLTAMGDGNGSTQKFVKKTFTAAKATKPRPVIEVTAVNTGDPYLATFNIKAGKDANGNVQPLMGAYFAVNYAREWELMFNQKLTYETILKGNYNFSSDELAKINSEEGYDYTVSTLDGETMRMAVYGFNDEYTFNAVEPDGVADYIAPYAPAKEPAAGYDALVAQLEGEWTATATIQAKALVEGTEDEYDTYKVDHKSRVLLTGSVPGTPVPVPESTYALYSGKSKDEVDGMLEELDMLCEAFSESRLKGQNRILACGFVDFDYHKNPGRLDWRSPFDLFVASDYSSYDVAQLLYDFGPKWYLEVLEDGSVIAPFNSEYLPPMHNWPGYPFYVGGYGPTALVDSNDDYPGFPVEISADGNTITIHPIVLEKQEGDVPAGTYYMNAFGFSDTALMQGTVELIAGVMSEIVLTRGWDGKTKSINAVPSSIRVPAKTMSGSAPSKPVVRKIRSVTEFKEPVKFNVDEDANYISYEKFDQVMTDAVKKYYNIK